MLLMISSPRQDCHEPAIAGSGLLKGMKVYKVHEHPFQNRTIRPGGKGCGAGVSRFMGAGWEVLDRVQVSFLNATSALLLHQQIRSAGSRRSDGVVLPLCRSCVHTLPSHDSYDNQRRQHMSQVTRKSHECAVKSLNADPRCKNGVYCKPYETLEILSSVHEIPGAVMSSNIATASKRRRKGWESTNLEAEDLGRKARCSYSQAVLIW